jgi:hypothetical protein
MGLRKKDGVAFLLKIREDLKQELADVELTLRTLTGKKKLMLSADDRKAMKRYKSKGKKLVPRKGPDGGSLDSYPFPTRKKGVAAQVLALLKKHKALYRSEIDEKLGKKVNPLTTGSTLSRYACFQQREDEKWFLERKHLKE